MKNQLGQLFIIGISGHSLTNDEKKFIVDNNIGGVILFARNIQSPEQVRNLCAEIQNLRHEQAEKHPLFISIDMEGGRVARLKKPFTEWPPLKYLGDLDSTACSFELGYSMGKELRAVGINLDYTPCIDVYTNPKNTVIGDRALSTDPEMVAKHAVHLIEGYDKAKVIHCVKHFPGHGNTIIDSHYDLPIEHADMNRLNQVELIPFKKTFQTKAHVLMTAHIHFDQIDPEWPVTLSEKFLKKILRQDLNFKGIVMTDDLDMKALAKYHAVEFLPVRSLQAGANMVLYCNEPESHVRGYASVQKAYAEKQIDEAWLKYSYDLVINLKKRMLQNPDPLPWTEAQKLVGHPNHWELSEAIRKGKMPDFLEQN